MRIMLETITQRETRTVQLEKSISSQNQIMDATEDHSMIISKINMQVFQFSFKPDLLRSGLGLEVTLDKSVCQNVKCIQVLQYSYAHPCNSGGRHVSVVTPHAHRIKAVSLLIQTPVYTISISTVHGAGRECGTSFIKTFIKCSFKAMTKHHLVLSLGKCAVFIDFFFFFIFKPCDIFRS